MNDDDAALMTLRDLAARWGVSERVAKRHVARHRVPFIQFGKTDRLLTRWANVRFRLSAIEEWERNSETVAAEETSSVARPSVPVRARHKHITIR